MSREYAKTVELVLEILPYALKDNRMALKGGTAINLFHRDFDRLSVDIDLCYLPLESRTETFKNIYEILKGIKVELEGKLNLEVVSNHPFDCGKEIKLIARKGDIEVKIEPNYTLRSSLFDPELIGLSPLAQERFGVEVEVQCLGLADTYGGKICAALDRQHPRDLFDVKRLLDNEGITRDIKDSFLFYLLSHNRPINEFLDPRFKVINNEYENEFLTMANTETSLEELLKARSQLIEDLKTKITLEDKEFLISFVSNKPDWSKARDSKIKDFPSVKWKMMNQEKMNETKLNRYIQNVMKALEIEMN